jgi:hypothetical protein
MRVEIGLRGTIRVQDKYNPFAGTDLAAKYSHRERDRPG